MGRRRRRRIQPPATPRTVARLGLTADPGALDQDLAGRGLGTGGEGEDTDRPGVDLPADVLARGTDSQVGTARTEVAVHHCRAELVASLRVGLQDDPAGVHHLKRLRAHRREPVHRPGVNLPANVLTGGADEQIRDVSGEGRSEPVTDLGVGLHQHLAAAAQPL